MVAYVVALGAIKTSFCLLYLHIFPGKKFRMACWCVLAILVAETIEETCVVIFQCQPVHKMWHPFMEEGSCLVLTDFFLGNAIPNIITDILILALPVFEVRRLQLPRVKKIAVGSIFLIGGA